MSNQMDTPKSHCVTVFYPNLRSVDIKVGDVLIDREDPGVHWRVTRIGKTHIEAFNVDEHWQEFPLHLLTWYFDL